MGVNRGSGVYGVATFGPEASEVGVLSAGEMSISWLGRSKVKDNDIHKFKTDKNGNNNTRI